MKVKWLLERNVFSEDLDPLVAEIQRQGMEVEQIRYVPFEAGSYDNFDDGDCVMCYMSLNLVRQLRREKPWIPGSFCDLPNFECSAYYAHFGQYLLNRDSYFMLPLSELKRRKEEIFDRFDLPRGSTPIRQIFVRPSCGFKTFSGQLLDLRHFDTDFSWFEEFATPESLVVVAFPKNILREWRFVIARKQVIAGSRYKPLQEPLGDSEADVRAKDLAQQIAQEEWAPDPMFVIDICEADTGFHLLEINSFSCSGLY